MIRNVALVSLSCGLLGRNLSGMKYSPVCSD